MILSGKTIAPGIARGVAHVIDARALIAAAQHITPDGTPQKEAERLHSAIGHACVELDRLQRQLTGRVQASDVSIFASHAGLLRDSKFVSLIEKEIYENGQSAEAAVSRVVNDLHTEFLAHKVALLEDKASDILDIGRRLLHCLSSTQGTEFEIGEAAVIVAASLTPSELVRFSHQGVVAVVTETCGPKSHTAILARGLAIPLLTGINSVCETVADHTDVIVDATGGRLIVAPTAAQQAAFQTLLDKQAAKVAEEESHAGPTITTDGVRIKVLFNISDPVEAEVIEQWDADGVGLFRTEFLYMDRTWWPSADENYAIYRQVSDLLGDRELNVRLVDFGAEKSPPYADIPLNRNPSLGLRGIRLLLQREDILRPQVIAIAKLARERPLTLLLPMLDTLDTLELAVEKLCRFSGSASRAELPFKLGTMIEVPAAAFLIDELVERVDSIAIGLNDLTQYLLAADRDDEFVERYHDPMQPVVLRLMRRILEAAEARNRPVTICGELAGDPKLTGLLLALGVRGLSVSRSNYLSVASMVRQLSLRSLDGVADEVVKLTTGAEVRKYVSEHFGSPNV